MENNESRWDKLLHIRTGGRDDSNADTYRYPYEPTPYRVLERLAGEEYIGKKNTLIDYGCGKGRVGLYLAYQTGCKSIGVEYDPRLQEKAEENRQTCPSGRKVTFLMSDAAEYHVPPEADRFYFFNPFSVELLGAVLDRIKVSYYENPREMLLFFYYPSDEYIARLMQDETLSFCDEIDCRDLFDTKDDRERIMIFEAL